VKALRWHGKLDVRCDDVPDPVIEDGRDAIVKVGTCAICGWELRLYDGLTRTMKHGDIMIMDYESMGELVEVGRDNRTLRVGKRVVVPFTIICGECDQCRRDIFPTGWPPAVQCGIEPTDTVVIRGGGAVGQMAVRSALILGAKQVVVIDRVPESLTMARAASARTIDFNNKSVLDRLRDFTQGKGPEKCVDVVGMKSHATCSFDAVYDRVKQAVMLETDRPHVLRQMIYVCRPVGTLSVPGVYSGLIGKIPFGAAINRGLTWHVGQTYVNRWTDDPLSESSAARSIRRSSSRTRSRSWTVQARTRPSTTSRTAASRSCSSPDRGGHRRPMEAPRCRLPNRNRPRRAGGELHLLTRDRRSMNE
jgi:threonine dehydrogenase-like Zn-dependent dehydrogenase